MDSTATANIFKWGDKREEQIGPSDERAYKGKVRATAMLTSGRSIFPGRSR